MGIEGTVIEYIVVVIHCSSTNAQRDPDRVTCFIDDRNIGHVKVMVGYTSKGGCRVIMRSASFILRRALDSESISARVPDLPQRSAVASVHLHHVRAFMCGNLEPDTI